MKIVTVIARILLGLIFLFFGLNIFFHFLPAVELPGMAGAYIHALVQSHYIFVIAAVQVVAGALLLVNRFVPLALALLAPLLVNILTFHIAMQPSGLPPGVFCTILWIILGWRYRAFFAPLLTRKAQQT